MIIHENYFWWGGNFVREDNPNSGVLDPDSVSKSPDNIEVKGDTKCFIEIHVKILKSQTVSFYFKKKVKITLFGAVQGEHKLVCQHGNTVLRQRDKMHTYLYSHS